MREARVRETSTERAAQCRTDVEARREAKAREISTQLMSANQGEVAERAKRVKLLVRNMYTCSLVIPYLNMTKEASLEFNQFSRRHPCFLYHPVEDEEVSSGLKKVEIVTNCHGRSCYLLVLKYPFKPLMRLVLE